MKKLFILASVAIALSACQTTSPTPQNPQTAQILVNQAPIGQTLTTSSGLSYKVLQHGTGKQVGINDEVQIRFTSYDMTGKMIDGTRSGSPVIVRPNQMFEGLKQALTLTQAGGRYEFYIPDYLGFSDDEYGQRQAVRYQVEVLAVNP